MTTQSHRSGLGSERGGPQDSVGVVGLGVMGSRMVKNLLKAGRRVIAFDVVPALVQKSIVLGAVGAASPNEVAKKCGIVILSLPSADTVRGVVLGEDGLIGGLAPDSVVVDTSTTDPDLPRELSSALQEKKCHFLDAPVSGGPEGAEKGTLTVMVGGDRESLDRCAGVLGNVGRSIIYVGETGSGQKVKLFNQALVAVYFGIVAEAFAWSERLGLKPQDLVKVIPTSWGDSPVFRHFVSTVETGNFADGASIRIYRKDISIILDSARKRGAEMTLLELASSMFEEAAEKGYAEDDASALLLLRRTGRA